MNLRPFIDSGELFSLSASLSWAGDILAAEYVLKGSFQNIPHLSTTSQAHLRAAELWKTTCFEWFLKPAAGDGYWEANFSPQGDWNLYYLNGYRKSLIIEDRVTTIHFASERSPLEWRLRTEVDFSKMSFLPVTLFKAHLSAVIETDDKKKSYWSLEHKQKQPDFHHPDHFILELQKEC